MEIVFILNWSIVQEGIFWQITFQKLFGEDLAESLWKHFTGNKPHHEAMTHEEFARHALPLVGTSTDIFVRMCLSSLEHLIKISSDAAGAAAVEGDEPFIAALVKDMVCFFLLHYGPSHLRQKHCFFLLFFSSL